MEKLLLILVFSSFMCSCASSRMSGQIPFDQCEVVKIKKIDKSEKATFLYGKYGKKKIRIAATPQEYFERNESYDIQLISLKSIIEKGNMRVPNHRIVYNKRIPGYRKNDPYAIRTNYKKYKDLYLTKDMATIEINIRNESPLFKTLRIEDFIHELE